MGGQPRRGLPGDPACVCVCVSPATAASLGGGAGGDPCPEGDGPSAGEAHLRPGEQTLPVHQWHGLARRPRPRARRGLPRPPPGIKAKSPQRAGAQSRVLSPGAKAAGRGSDPDNPPTTGIGRILLPGRTPTPRCSAWGGVPFRCLQAGAAEHPSAGTCEPGTGILPGWGLQGPPAQDALGHDANPPPPPPPPSPPSAGAPNQPFAPGSPFNKGLGQPVAAWPVPGMWDHHAGGALPAHPPHAPPVQAERGRERQTLKSIYWCWPRSELLGLPRPWPRRCLWGAWRWWGGGTGYEKSQGSENGPPLPPPPPWPPAPRVQRGAARGGGPGVSTI